MTGKLRVEGEALAGIFVVQAFVYELSQRPAAPARSCDAWSTETSKAPHEVLHLLRDADRRPDARVGGAVASTTASSRRCSPTSSAITACGRSSTTASTSTRTRRRPRSSCRSSRRRPSASASATASRSCRIATTIPIRIAERVATLDILSGGRVNWGSGKSSSLVEQHAFENDLKTLHDQWLEALEMIPRMWSSDVFEHKGRFFQIPPTQIMPEAGAAAASADVRRLHQAGVGGRRSASSASARSTSPSAPTTTCTQKVQRVQARRSRAGARRSAARRPTGSPARRRRWSCPTIARPASYGLRGARFFAEAMARYYLSGTRPTGKLRRAARLPHRRRSRRRRWRTATSRARRSAAIVGDPACGARDRVALRRHRRRRADPGHADGHRAARADHASRCARSPRRSCRTSPDDQSDVKVPLLLVQEDCA